MTMAALSQLIKIELINQKELQGLCEDVNNKIGAMKHAVKLLELMLSSITSLPDYVSSCKAFLAMHTTIGEAIHAIQSYSIVSCRVEGMEIGRWRIIFPHHHPLMKWLNLSSNFTTRKKKELDSLLKELEIVFESILVLQDSLINLGEGGGFLSTHFKNHHHDDHAQQNQITLIGSPINQSIKSWDYDIIIKKKELINSLAQAKEWNLDSFLILRNLIEWDYKHRFSVGERSDEENELQEVFVETLLNESQFFSYNNDETHRIPCNKITVSSNNIKRNQHRSKRLLLFSFFFVSILLMCIVFVV